MHNSLKSALALLYISCILVAPFSSADFTFEQDGGRMSVLENGELVTVYNFADESEKGKADSDLWDRSNYFYPVIGMNGRNISSNYPSDHVHHRGIFWCWPECKVGDKRLDMWLLQDTRYQYQGIETITDDAAGTARMSIVNSWVYKDDPVPIVNEEVTVDFHPATETHRIIDFTLTITNVHQEPVTIQGATDKGYGGFKFRLDAERKPFTFVSRQGAQEEDTWHVDSPWMDTTWEDTDGATQGVAIFQHLNNPDYPHDGWMIRHYGIVGPAWPHEEARVLKTGEAITLKYRLVLHSGDTDAAGIADLHDGYVVGVP